MVAREEEAGGRVTTVPAGEVQLDGRRTLFERVNVSPLWGAAAVASLLTLAVFASDGLLLLAFLGVVIVAHEAGHLVVARRAGMRPTEFFWGFGPEVIAVTVGDCRYGIKAVFLGGYVKLLGMTPSSEVPDDYDESLTYRAASHRGRLATILAGPFVNIAMAAIAFAAAAALQGASPATALATGLGDVWFVIDGTAQALWLWVSNLGSYAASVFDPGAAEPPVRFMSPVSQAEVSGWAVDAGPITTLRWFAILSCAVGAVNLLPLPPLDGSHALVAAVEGIVQRFKRWRSVSVDVARLLPLAYLTVTVLVLLSLSALVLDIRDVI